MLNAYIIRL